MGIFRNDYKVPQKNLWVEKQSMAQPQPSHGHSFVDNFEDKLFNSQPSDNQSETKSAGFKTAEKTATIDQTNGESEYLIFERHFDDAKAPVDDKKLNEGDTSSQGATDSVNHDEDLGIIDLDELENNEEKAFFDD